VSSVYVFTDCVAKFNVEEDICVEEEIEELIEYSNLEVSLPWFRVLVFKFIV
jgi:hypothetical protein